MNYTVSRRLVDLHCLGTLNLVKKHAMAEVQKNLPVREKKDKSKIVVDSLPDFIIKRNELFDKLKQEYNDQLSKKVPTPIRISLDRSVVKIPGCSDDSSEPEDGKAFQTTPGSFLRYVDKAIASDIVISKVDGQLWDLDRPLERDCRVTFVPFSSDEGRKVFWHSSAHVLGEAAECQYNCLLSHGPPVDAGFFYDMAMGENVVSQSDWAPLESRAAKYFREKQPFERLHVSIENLREMFGYSKYKMYYIENLLPKEGSTVYKCGTLVDLCLGPHIQNTSKIKAFQIMKNSSCYFRGDKDDDSLQRIYGVAFPDKKQLTEHKRMLEEAAKRDHRKIGVQQKLFHFDGDLAPGNVFLLPHGTIIFNELQALLRSQYKRRKYKEVQSPNMYNSDLWKKSGHWQHYQDDMFGLDVGKQRWALKPMNCPGHCLIFKIEERSYRELPLRLADFGVLHRNEASGALDGLMRVRKFQQDDTHIFCTNDQITQEIEGLFDFMSYIYGLFGFGFKLRLSTRPDKYLGRIEEWDLAESKLKAALDKFAGSSGKAWEENPGDGAFYGPKIDVYISDALKRDHQCATIQLDFQLPQNFELEYKTSEVIKKESDTTGEPAADQLGASKAPQPGYSRPVMIHRAIVGSFERFMAILIEHFAGKWPFWLSPRQILIVPVMPAVNDYVEEVQQIFEDGDLIADIDISDNTMPKKIRTGQLQQYNFIFVVGAQEKETRSVNIRNRDDQDTQSRGEVIPVDEALTKLQALKKERRLVNGI